MKFGFPIPTRGPLANPGNIAQIAVKGEELGFEFISFSDHIIMPKLIESDYPYNEDGRYPGELFGSKAYEYLDQLTVIAWVAARTKKIRMLTSVMVVPYRSVVHTAKALASIDVLSKGRLILGVGSGWMREEFEALSAPPFDHRGTVTEEYLLAFQELWTSETPRFKGRYVNFRDIKFEPKPVQHPTPPIWMGGESMAALRRAAQLADGWFPFAHPRPPAISSIKGFRASLIQLNQIIDKSGREFKNGFEIAIDAEMMFDSSRELRNRDGSRQMLTGSPEAIREDVSELEAVGVGQIQVLFPGVSLSEVTCGMESFAKTFMTTGSK